MRNSCSPGRLIVAILSRQINIQNYETIDLGEEFVKMPGTFGPEQEHLRPEHCTASFSIHTKAVPNGGPAFSYSRSNVEHRLRGTQGRVRPEPVLDLSTSGQFLDRNSSQGRNNGTCDGQHQQCSGAGEPGQVVLERRLCIASSERPFCRADTMRSRSSLRP